MRRIAPLLAIIAALGSFAGCAWLDKMRPDPKPGTGALKPKKSEEFVSYLNRQSGFIQTVRYDDVSLKATIPGQSWVPALRSGMMVAQKPKNFRMQAGLALGGDQLDIGSNSQEFWMYVKQPKPTYLFCTHADFPRVQDDLPVPFEPDWVIQALGMSTYDATRKYEVETSEKEGAYYLKWEDTTPAGQKVMKVTEFAGDSTEGSQPQVRKHVVLTQTKTGWQKTMIAEIHKVSVQDAGTDPQTGQRAFVQVPTDVTLEWPQQKVKLALSLGKPQLNTREETVLFSKPPKIDNASPVNLADFRSHGSPSGLIRGATPGDLPVERKRR